MSVDRTRQEFMEKMDRLWKAFDTALDNIPDDQAEAFEDYADLLDKFFVCYWKFFNGMNEGVSVAHLEKIATVQYNESVRQLEEAWRNTARAQFRKTRNLLRARRRSRALPSLRTTFLDLRDQWKKLKKIDMIEKRIKRQKQMSVSLSILLKRLEAAN
jgi:hypothetical protein